MTNRPYEIDMPSLTNLRAMEDEAMGFSPSNSPEHSKVVRQHPPATANEGNTPVTETDSAERQNLQQCLPEDDPDGRRGDASPTDLRETGRMDVDVGTEDQALNSHEMITRCEGHWLFANAVLEERQLGVSSQAKGKGKGKGVEPRASPIPAPYIEESMHSNAEVDDLCMHKSDPTLPDSTAEGQEYLVPKDDLLIMLEVGFAERPYWTTADLADALQQPGIYLNEVLPQIAIFGPWLGGYPQRWCWRLKVAEEKSEGRWKGKGRAESWE